MQNGSLAMPGGRDIAPIINSLLTLPFTAKVASQDWHPLDHASFDVQHPPPNNKAFTSWVTATNPDDESKSMQLQLWPVHCVRDTTGAKIIPEIDATKLDLIVQKGQDKRTEMFSAFGDMFSRGGSSVVSHDLAAWLKNKKIQQVFVVGLTGDCCVKATAIDAKKEGFETFVVGDATRSVDDGNDGWGAAKREFQEHGVIVIESRDQRLQDLKS